jgi:hypothetical protein
MLESSLHRYKVAYKFLFLSKPLQTIPIKFGIKLQMLSPRAHAHCLPNPAVVFDTRVVTINQ